MAAKMDPMLRLALAYLLSAALVLAQDVQQTYLKFREWVTATLPPSEQNAPKAFDLYRAKLISGGTAAAEADRIVQLLRDHRKKAEIELWNRVLTSEKPGFNTQPNQFLVRMTRGVHPGKALDVGMGQGRNALYLAQQGWEVTGFDPAERAVKAAEAQAAKMGVKLTTLVQETEKFDFGHDRWDLIVLSYVDVRGAAPMVRDSLRPGGLVVIEGFHRDATKGRSIGGRVVFDSNELLKLFSGFRVLQYEDTLDRADFGLEQVRVVRLCAQK